MVFMNKRLRGYRLNVNTEGSLINWQGLDILSKTHHHTVKFQILGRFDQSINTWLMLNEKMYNFKKKTQFIVLYGFEFNFRLYFYLLMSNILTLIWPLRCTVFKGNLSCFDPSSWHWIIPLDLTLHAFQNTTPG